MLSLLTFPGVIIHELGHKLFCDLMKVKVRKVCYFQLGNPAGYVVHDAPTNFKQSFFITLGPFIVGTLLSLLFYLYSNFYDGNITMQITFIWLGFSTGMKCFPSDQDAKVLWKETNRHIRKNLFAIIGYPFSLLIWIVNKLHAIKIDIIYAVFLYLVINPQILNILI